MKNPWRLGYMGIDGRGSWIRTNGCRDQNPVPYHLAIPLMRQNFNIFAVKCQGKLTVLQQMSVLSFFEKMAGVAGFEPTDAEIKTRCLTTWRYPYLGFTLSWQRSVDTIHRIGLRYRNYVARRAQPDAAPTAVNA